MHSNSSIIRHLNVILLVLVSAFTLVGLNRLPPEPYSMIAVYVAHWRRYVGIWLREGSQVLPGKTPCLPLIFHRRIDRATRCRRLPEQTPPRFSPEPGCGPNTAGYQTNPPSVALPGTEAPDGIALALPVATVLPRLEGLDFRSEPP